MTVKLKTEGATNVTVPAGCGKEHKVSEEGTIDCEECGAILTSAGQATEVEAPKASKKAAKTVELPAPTEPLDSADAQGRYLDSLTDEQREAALAGAPIPAPIEQKAAPTK